MYFLLLDPRFKTFILCPHLLVMSKVKQLLKNMTKKIVSYASQMSLSLHPLLEFERGVVDQKVEEKNNLDIFEMTTSTSEPTTKLTNKYYYQVDVKDINWSL